MGNEDSWGCGNTALFFVGNFNFRIDNVLFLCYDVCNKTKGEQSKKEQNMIKKVIHKNGRSVTFRHFSGNNELSNWIRITGENAYTKENKYIRFNPMESTDKSWTGTGNYQEAEQLLLHGWEYGTKQLQDCLKTKQVEQKTKRRSVYDVQGYQACVPRYLQGMPDSMIRSKNINVPNKVITINKGICYSCNIKTEKIIKESTKVLRLVQELELKGYRVNLNVVCIMQNSSNLNRFTITRMNIKKSSQRLNLKQIAFPLVHPSMLRRFMIAVCQRAEECSNKGFRSSGRPYDYADVLQGIADGEYYIPSIVPEQTITDIEQYKI